MESNETTRGESRVSQFRNLSDIDKNVLNRLTADRTNKKTSTENLDLTPLSAVFRRNLRDATDIRNIFQTMPDLHLPREILISAIMSPGDMAQRQLIFGNDMKGCDTALTAPMVQYLEDFHVKERKMDAKAPEWVDDALIWSGAHPILIIPEATLDKLVLGQDASMESIASYGGEFVDGWYRPKGLLGIKIPSSNGDVCVSLESATRRHLAGKSMVDYHTIKGEMNGKKVTLPIRVTDNLAVLRTPVVQQLRRSRAFESAYGTPSLESKRRQRHSERAKKEPDANELYNKYYRSPQQVSRSRLQVVTTDRMNKGSGQGHPLEYHLATEAVVPVCVPGDASNHVGYIILLDGNGYPISQSRRLNYYDDIRRGAQGAGDGSGVAGELIQMSKEAIVGGISQATNSQIDRLIELHAGLMDADIVSRLKVGEMGGDFELSHTDHVDRLTFARSMKNQMTTMLYVPAELMIYMAYEFNEYGVGKSILEDAKALAAMRAAVTVAGVIGSTRNAIPGKDINIELPEDDADPMASATFMLSEAVGLAYHQFPMELTSTTDLARNLQMSSFSVNVTGNPRFPEVKTSITPRESSFAQIDTDLQQQLRDDLTRVFGLTPEMVDNVNQPEFATTAVQNSLMLQKRVMVIQGKTNPMLTDYVRVFTYNSGILIDGLLDLIEKNAKYLPEEFKGEPEDFLEEFLNNLTVKLPEPETDNLTKQMELFKNYSQSLDEALPAYLAPEFLDGFAPDKIKEATTTVLAAWKGVILREWMRKKGVFRELDVFTNAEDGSPMMDLSEEMSNHVEGLMRAIGPWAKRVAKDTIKRKVEVAKTLGEMEKAEKMLQELSQPDEPDETLDDNYGGGQELANGNIPEESGGELDEAGNPIEGTETTDGGEDGLGIDLGTPGDGTDGAPAEGAETTDASPTTGEDDQSLDDALNIDLDEPDGVAPADPAEDEPPAKGGDDLAIDLGEPGKEEDAPAEVPAEPDAKEDDLKIDLGEPEADDKDKPAKGGKKKPDESDDDLKIDLGEPGKS